MSDNDKTEGEEQLDLVTRDNWGRKDESFDDFDDGEDFEESDRDSDFAAVFTEVEEEEEGLLEETPSEEDFTFEPHERPSVNLDQEAKQDPPWENGAIEPSESTWGNLEDDTRDEPGSDQPAPEVEDTWVSATADEPGDDDNEADPGFGFIAAAGHDDEDWEEDEEYYEEEERETSLPLGLIIVGIIALVLLGAGGYGVMQDRAALQEEVRDLQAALATTASPKEVAQTRAASETTAARNQQLEQQVAEMSRENRSLQAIVAGLETQLQAQQEALARPKTPAPPKPAPPAPKTEPKAPAAAAVTTANTGTWFVNFGSYSQRATAESWAKRLKPGAGEVIVATGNKDGRTFYRVRVVNLATRDVANATAKKLEQKYDLSRLWIGQAG